jgi:hypothetical protein
MRATIKLAPMVAKLDLAFPIDASHIIIAPPATANKKLLAGLINKLEIAIGIKKT